MNQRKQRQCPKKVTSPSFVFVVLALAASASSCFLRTPTVPISFKTALRRYDPLFSQKSSEMPMAPPPQTSAASSLFSLVLQNRLQRTPSTTADDSKRNNEKQVIHSAIPIAGVHDALSAKIFAQHGAPALFLSGFGVSASLLGIPDAGMTNLVEMEMMARHICSVVRNKNFPNSTPPPIIVDGDTGYGGSANMLRTITALATAGAAAITIEDQTFPKKCTIAAGDKIRIVDREMAMQRVKAALGARDLFDEKSAYSMQETAPSGPGVWIVARTDCRLAFGFEEVVERCLRFEEMGADIVYAENLQSVSEYQELRNRLDSRTITMVAQVQETLQNERSETKMDGKPLLTIQDIGDLGYDMALFGVTPLQCVVGVLEKSASKFLGTGIIHQPLKDTQIPMADFGTVKRVVGFDALEEFENKFPCG